MFNGLQLNEKSDVYGFGVVLCEIITGQRAIINLGNNVRENISSWMSNIIETKGDVHAIVDGRLLDNYDVNSAWKFVEIATSCILSSSLKRPTMNQVVIDLKQCLEMENGRKYGGGGRESQLNRAVFDEGFLNVTSTGPAAR